MEVGSARLGPPQAATKRFRKLGCAKSVWKVSEKCLESVALRAGTSPKRTFDFMFCLYFIGKCPKSDLSFARSNGLRVGFLTAHACTRNTFCLYFPGKCPKSDLLMRGPRHCRNPPKRTFDFMFCLYFTGKCPKSDLSIARSNGLRVGFLTAHACSRNTFCFYFPGKCPKSDLLMRGP